MNKNRICNSFFLPSELPNKKNCLLRSIRVCNGWTTQTRVDQIHTYLYVWVLAKITTCTIFTKNPTVVSILLPSFKFICHNYNNGISFSYSFSFLPFNRSHTYSLCHIFFCKYFISVLSFLSKRYTPLSTLLVLSN